MERAVTHDRNEETPEAKARWFQALTLTERMDLLCAYYDLLSSVNPSLINGKDAQPVKGRVLVLSKT